jgi:hypothetical protein
MTDQTTTAPTDDNAKDLTRMSISGVDKANEEFSRLRDLLAVPATDLTMEERMERVEAVALVLVESVAMNLQVLAESVSAVDDQFVLIADGVNRHAKAIGMLIDAFDQFAAKPKPASDKRIITLGDLGR